MIQNRRAANYRAYLRSELKSQKISITAFARQIGVSPAFLSQVFNKQRGLSEERAAAIASHLRLDDTDAKYFGTLVRYENAKTAALRAQLKRELDTFKNSSEVATTFETPLQIDTFAAISNWYHGAILELTELADYCPDVEWIARKLKIQPIEADTALRRLIRLGLLSQTGTTHRKTNNHLVAGYISSKAVRNYHKQMLGLATKALEEKAFEERDVRGTTFAIAKSQLPTVKKLLDDVFATLRQRERNIQPSELYHLSAQLFRLDQDIASKFNSQPNKEHLHG